MPLDLPEHLAEHFALAGKLEFLDQGEPQRDLTAAELADEAAQEVSTPRKTRKKR